MHFRKKALLQKNVNISFIVVFTVELKINVIKKKKKVNAFRRI